MQGAQIRVRSYPASVVRPDQFEAVEVDLPASGPSLVLRPPRGRGTRRGQRIAAG